MVVVVLMYSEASEELPLDSSQPQEANDVNHQKDDIVSGPLAEPAENQNLFPSSSNEPPKLSVSDVSESSVSPPIPKSLSVPEVSPAARPKLSAKVDTILS